MVANSKMIFLMHINSIIIDSMCGLSFLNKRVSLVYGDTLLMCAGHGMSSVGDKPTTGSYRQV